MPGCGSLSSLSLFLSLSCSIWRARFLPKLPTRRVWPPPFPFYCAHSTPHVSNWTQLDRVCGQQFPLSPLPFSSDLTFHADVVVVSGDGIKFNISVYKWQEKERYSNFRNQNRYNGFFNSWMYVYTIEFSNLFDSTISGSIFKDSNPVKILYPIFGIPLLNISSSFCMNKRQSCFALKTRLFATHISL